MGCVRIGRPIYKCVVALPRPGLRSDLIHRSGEGTSLRKGLVSWPARKPVLSSLDGRYDRRGPDGRGEGFIVGEHAMHDHGELARERHLGLAHAAAPGDAHRPA